MGLTQYRIINTRNGVLSISSSNLHKVGGNEGISEIILIDDDNLASLSNVGKMRYTNDIYNSYVDVVMQTGDNLYEWVNIVQNNWTAPQEVR